MSLLAAPGAVPGALGSTARLLTPVGAAAAASATLGVLLSAPRVSSRGLQAGYGPKVVLCRPDVFILEENPGLGNLFFKGSLCAKHQILKITHRMALVFNVHWYVCELC